MINIQEIKENRKQIIETIESLIFKNRFCLKVTLKDVMLKVIENSKLGCFHTVEEDMEDVIEMSYQEVEEIANRKAIKNIHALEEMRIENSRELMKNI